jgi:hypothetical protein
MKKLSYEVVIKELPELKDFALDGQTDFTRISRVVGSKNPKLVWGIINALEGGPVKANPAVSRLMGLLEK